MKLHKYTKAKFGVVDFHLATILMNMQLTKTCLHNNKSNQQQYNGNVIA